MKPGRKTPVKLPSSRSTNLKIILPITACLGFMILMVMGYAVYLSNASQIGQSPDSHSVPIIGNRIPEIGATSAIDYFIKPHQHGNVYGVLSGMITKKRLETFMLEAGLSQLPDNDNWKKQIHIDSLERFRRDGQAFFSGQLTQDDYFFERPLEGTNEIYGVFRQKDGLFVLFISFSNWRASLTGDEPLK